VKLVTLPYLVWATPELSVLKKSLIVEYAESQRRCGMGEGVSSPLIFLSKTKFGAGNALFSGNFGVKIETVSTV